MEITLEKIELVKDRTGVTYADAKKALEDADGSVVDAIIAIEETVNSGKTKRGFGQKGEELFKKLKDLVKKGNVARIKVKREGDTILNVPVNAGIVGICIAPLASVVGLVAAFGFKCAIEVVKTDGTVVDVSEAVTDTVRTATEKGSDKADFLKSKGKEYYEKAKEQAGDSEIIDKAKDKAAEAKEKGQEYYNKAKEKAGDSDIIGKAKDKVAGVADKFMKAEADKFDMSDLEDDEQPDVDVEIEIESDEADTTADTDTAADGSAADDNAEDKE